MKIVLSINILKPPFINKTGDIKDVIHKNTIKKENF